MNNNTNNKNNEWSKRDIGALWKREGQNQKYLSGYVKVDELGIEKEVKIVVFSNKNKSNNEKAPDYRIYVSKPLEIPKQTSQPVLKKKEQPKKVAEVSSEADEDLL
jgi:uncharacterized protein (DUF736 family)